MHPFFFLDEKSTILGQVNIYCAVNSGVIAMSLLLPVVMILSILVGIKIVCVISGFS
jgi:hypothetical protein